MCTRTQRHTRTAENAYRYTKYTWRQGPTLHQTGPLSMYEATNIDWLVISRTASTSQNGIFSTPFVFGTPARWLREARYTGPLSLEFALVYYFRQHRHQLGFKCRRSLIFVFSQPINLTTASKAENQNGVDGVRTKHRHVEREPRVCMLAVRGVVWLRILLGVVRPNSIVVG